MSVEFVTFGTPNFSMARVEHSRSIEGYGYPVHSLYISSDPIKTAREENPEIFRNQRGHGLWAWKPYIIEAVLDKAAPGMLVFYTDIAVRMDGSPKKMLDALKDLDIATFRVGSGYHQREYTKRDAFIHMDADDPHYWDDEQSNGAFFAVRNSDAGRKFVSEWKGYVRDPRIIADEPHEHPPLPEFIAHRHDQSILSILATRHTIPLFRDPSQWGNDGIRDFKASNRIVPLDFGQVFFHHRARDRDYARYFV